MTDAIRQKAINGARILLIKVRGLLLAGNIGPAVYDLHYFVLPMLAGAVQDADTALAGQLMVSARFTTENLVDNVFIDWPRLEEAERHLERGDAIAAMERVGWVVVPIQDHKRYVTTSSLEMRDGRPYFHQTGEPVRMDQERPEPPVVPPPAPGDYSAPDPYAAGLDKKRSENR